MYNNIGLSTPRGSGTNGHIQTNRSHLRARETFDRTSTDTRGSKAAFREPDQGILNHERNRKVEVACLELRIKLEDDGVEEAIVEQKVQDLRERLLKAGAATANAHVKPHQTHEFNKAKEDRNETVRRAFGISQDHVEGIAFDKEKQEELKIQRQVERAQAAEERAKIAKMLAEERERARANEGGVLPKRPLRSVDDAPPAGSSRRDAPLQYDHRRRSRSPSPRRYSRRDDSRSPPPPRRRRVSYSHSRSPVSPPPPQRRRSSRSPSPDRRRRPDSRSPPPPRRGGRSPSPYAARRGGSRSPSPPPRGRARDRSASYSSYSSRSRSRSYSRSPPRRRLSRSRSPAPRRP